MTLAEQIMAEISQRPMSAPALGYELGCSAWEAWVALCDLRRQRLIRAAGNPYHRDTIYHEARIERSAA